jgi:glycosyltransferase involved in cell wall biosynthesis
MPAPLVSVLVPVFNGQPFMAEALDSILCQSYEHFELLISDDGSNDGSSALIESYARKDSRVRWWRNPRNLGLGPNFNLCLKAAKADLVKFMLHDDKFLHRDALSKLVAALEASPSASLAASASWIIDTDSKRSQLRNRFGASGLRSGRQTIVQCLAENANLIGEPSLTLFRKSHAHRGFLESFGQLLDLEMWFHLLEQGDFAFVDEPLCAFRQHPAQQTEKNRSSGATADESMALTQFYYARPWMKEFATKRMIFAQMYQLQKAYGERAAPLIREMGKSLSRSEYHRLWVQHKLTKPLRNLSRWIEKRLAHP